MMIGYSYNAICAPCNNITERKNGVILTYKVESLAESQFATRNSD